MLNSTSELGVRTVSFKTALACLDRISEVRDIPGNEPDGEWLDRDAVVLSQLIRLGRKRGIKLRALSLNWSSLLIATATGPVLLRLNNGNMILALNNTEGHPQYIVVSDPLHDAGRSFFLPRDALEQVWAGDTCTIKPRSMKAERAIARLACALSACGLRRGR